MTQTVRHDYFTDKPPTPEAEAVFAVLHPVFRWTCADEHSQKYDISIPAVVDGKVVATDGRVMVWVEATPELAAAVDKLREGRRPFVENLFRDTVICPAGYGDDLPPLDFSGVAPCDKCDGKGQREAVACGCCGELTYTPGVAFVCGECSGSGLDPKGEVPAGPALLGPRFAKTLSDWGAVFRCANTDPRTSTVRFRLPGGVVEGVLMPLRPKDERVAARARTGVA
jgi:hypothetical protein